MDLSRGRAALLLALCATALFTGCGSSGESAPETAVRSVDTAPDRSASAVDKGRYVARAEAICRRALRETRALGRNLSGVLSNAPSPQQGITSGLVRPGTEILSREAAELRDLRPQPDSRLLEIYLGLFDPIVELGRQRLLAGTADEPDRAHDLELMIASLGNEQSVAAHRFGLQACGVPFTRALGGSGQ
jgi:hypothetical protein